MKKKDRNMIANIAKLLAGSLLMAAVLSAVQPAMAAYADEADQTSTEAEVKESAEAETAEAGSEGTAGETESSGRPLPLPLPDGTESTSITVTMKLSDGTEVSGDTLSAYKIAEIGVDDEGFKYEYTEKFKSLADGYPLSPVDESDPDAVIKEGLADAAAGLVTEDMDSAAEKKVENGTAKFIFSEGDDKAKLGLFLIVQTMSDENKDLYKPILPFLVTIPFYDEDNAIYYDVQAEPKMELDKIIEELTPCKADPPVEKIVEIDGKGTPKEGTFWFFFERGNDAYPMPDYEDPASQAKAVDENKAELSLTTNSTADGEYGWIEFTKAGEYTYYLTEDETRLPDDYKAKYPGYKYTIHYHVTIDEEAEGLEVSSIDVETSDGKKFTLEGGRDYEDVKAAQPAASKFPFYNTYKVPDPPSTDPTPTETTRPKRSETTPHDRRDNPPPSTGETPTVAGATRTPEPEGDVLGAARTPQAVLGASRLPQTGQLWWPVPVLMVAGIALMAGGLVRRRSEE